MCLIIGLLLLSCLPLLWYWQAWQTQPSYAEIWVNNALWRTVPLAQGHEETFSVPNIPGYAIIEVKDGAIRLQTDDSPRQIGVHMGWIRQPYEQILNVPYKILILIKGDAPNSSRVDATAQ